MLTLVGIVVTSRATKSAALATARANTAAAAATAEPNQRAADLEAFRAIREDMQCEIGELRQEHGRLQSLVYAFVGYVAELSAQMRDAGLEPSAPPARVEEYNRTGA
ncbi:hypothetical protein ACFWJT_15980 [Streptomyces sp. NPDC127069]|uniref:hypothetical protein n=1 Tax=Streptomyces sp. NPDC127069 TaxID=3347128 RepID=UPI00365C51C5